MPPLAGVSDVAPWWNRDNSVEVDLVATAGSKVEAIGSVKWRERRRFTRSEGNDLAEARSVVPHSGAARLIAVCPAGAEVAAGIDVVLTAADLLRAWD